MEVLTIRGTTYWKYYLRYHLLEALLIGDTTSWKYYLLEVLPIGGTTY